VFLQQDVAAVTEALLAGHLADNAVLQAAFSLNNRCTGSYPQRQFWMQAGENDTDFLRRIWAREGISFVIQTAPDSNGAFPQHQVVLFDDPSQLDENPAGSVRFHRADGTEASDSVTQWQACRVLQGGSVAHTSWDRASASVGNTSETSDADQGQGGNALASTLEDYAYTLPAETDGLGAFTGSALPHMQSLELLTKHFEGEGTVRTFAPGTTFELTERFGLGQNNDYALLRVQLAVVNNFKKEVLQSLSAFPAIAKAVAPAGSDPAQGPEPPFRVRFTCVRSQIPIVPPFIAPPDPGLLTAVVVGPPGEEVHTDALGRIKVRFPFARQGEHSTVGASDTDQDCTWVPLSQPMASQNFGATWLPRVGDEVMVQFLSGDPDRPVITGCVHNAAATPATFSQAASMPGDKALTGIRSQMFQGSGGNELVFDNSVDQLRARLASDHARTELNLGYLVQPRSGGVASPKGEGFELRTDAYGVARAEQGMLISTDGRNGGSGVHLDAQELTDQIQASMDLTQSLAKVAQIHQTPDLAVQGTTQGLHQSAAVTTPAGNGDQAANVAAFDKAILALSSPAGIVEGTPGTLVKTAGGQFHLASGQDTNLAVGRNLAMAVQGLWTAFAALGIKLFAAKGDVAIQAHSGNTNLTADQDVSLAACNQGVTVGAGNSITLAAGGVKVSLAGGSLEVHGQNVFIKANLSIGGGSSASCAMPTLPQA